MTSERRVILLGSTGSVGTQSLAVIDHLNAIGEGRRLRVVGLAARRSGAALAAQAAAHPGCAFVLAEQVGDAAVVELIERTPCDLVVSAMSGSAGLPATLRALELGRDVALANKESLVAAGEVMTRAARASGARLLPMDSEHAGVWECARGVTGDGPPTALGAGAGVSRVVLTASGGPFRTWDAARTWGAGPTDALKHPTWRMGPKVTVDSASLMNKALELIEAHWLFGLPPERLGVVVHPQSIVHAMIELSTGSVLAQLGEPDMRTPILNALAWPERPAGLARRLRLDEIGRLEFEPVDDGRFPAVGLAFDVMRAGGSAGAVLNAANEVAVEAFLAGRMPFGRIAQVVTRTLSLVPRGSCTSLADVLDADRRGRACAARLVGEMNEAGVTGASTPRELWS